LGQLTADIDQTTKNTRKAAILPMTYKQQMHAHFSLEHLTDQMHQAQTTYQDSMRYHDKQIGQ
jgi:hypothetical protein